MAVSLAIPAALSQENCGFGKIIPVLFTQPAPHEPVAHDPAGKNDRKSGISRDSVFSHSVNDGADERKDICRDILPVRAGGNKLRHLVFKPGDIAVEVGDAYFSRSAFSGISPATVSSSFPQGNFIPKSTPGAVDRHPCAYVLCPSEAGDVHVVRKQQLRRSAGDMEGEESAVDQRVRRRRNKAPPRYVPLGAKTGKAALRMSMPQPQHMISRQESTAYTTPPHPSETPKHPRLPAISFPFRQKGAGGLRCVRKPRRSGAVRAVLLLRQEAFSDF